MDIHSFVYFYFCLSGTFQIKDISAAENFTANSTDKEILQDNHKKLVN